MQLNQMTAHSLLFDYRQTVNTAARMESHGKRGRIQVSEQTADLLMEAGKGSWIKRRSDMIEAKGKGLLATWWLDPKLDNLFSSATASPDPLGISCMDQSRAMNHEDTDTASSRRSSH